MKLKKPLIMDGAMGTELMRRGLKLPLPLWSSLANIEHNNQVINVHKDYIDAGSDIITPIHLELHLEPLSKLGIHKKMLD